MNGSSKQYVNGLQMKSFHSKNRNVVTKTENVLFQLNVVHKDAM